MAPIQTRVQAAVIVTRVSTGEQVKHGTSLESQLEVCRTKAAALGVPIFKEYEDAGLSGGLLLTRDGMQSAIADITAGRASMLICANISRYSRDVEHQQSIRKQVRAAGGSVVFCDMDYADTPEGDLAFSIMGGFAQYERKVIRERMMRGRQKRAEEGQQPARSTPPYGYHIVTHADVTRETYPAEMVGRYVLRSDTAPIARRIFETYASGASFRQLCIELNTERIPSPGNGRGWHEPTIRLVLTNPVYKGEPRSNRIRCRIDESRLSQRHRLTGDPIKSVEVRYLAPESEWRTLEAPPLVSAELWQSVQDRIERMKEAHRGSNKQLRMLSGLTYCPKCGCRTKIRYQKANGKRFVYLRCSAFDNARSLPERPCEGTVYSVEAVEDAVRQAIREAIDHPEAIASALAAYRETQRPSEGSAREELRSLDKAVEQLRSEESAAIQAQIAGIRAGASPDAYSAVFADIAGRRKDMENRRGELSRRVAIGDSNQPEKSGAPLSQISLADTLSVLASETVPGSDKHELVMEIVDRVVCRKGGAEIFFVPGAFGENGPGDEEGRKSIVHTTCIGISTHR